MSGGGDWFARGESNDGRRFAVRNGTAIAVTGQAITPETTEAYTVIHTVNGNSGGDYIVGGTTTTGDDVVVLNGDTVIARTGDPVTLGGAGPLTEAFLGAFAANDAFLSDDLNDDLVDDRELYAFATLHDDQGEPLGDAFVVVRMDADCPWDCGVVDGEVDVLDFLALLADWGMIGSACDFNGNGVDVVDFLKLLSAWGPCP